VLKVGLLEGVVVAVAGEPRAAGRCEELGAQVGAPTPDADVLVCDTGELDEAFDAARDQANRWIAAERGGKVVLVAPAGDAPLQAALENLARTLSIEWARYGITPTAILPGVATTREEVGELIAFLASPAGDYYSGCSFSLGRA
jgi:hypothetical protein